MAEIDITKLQKTLDDINEYLDKKNNKKLEGTDKLVLRYLQNQAEIKLCELLDSNNLEIASPYIKVSSLDINIACIAEVLDSLDYKYKISNNIIYLSFSGIDGFKGLLGLQFAIENEIWLVCRANIQNYKVKEGKKNDLLELINYYSSKTRHSKAYIDGNNILVLERNDSVDIIWTKDDLKEILLQDIIIMSIFFKDYASKLQTLLEMDMSVINKGVPENIECHENK